MLVEIYQTLAVYVLRDYYLPPEVVMRKLTIGIVLVITSCANEALLDQFDSEVKAKATATNKGFTIKHTDSLDCLRPTLRIETGSMPESIYTAPVSDMAPGASLSFAYSDFSNNKGARLNYDTTKPLSITLVCGTLNGGDSRKASWHFR